MWEIFFVVLLVAAFNLVCCLNIVLEGITNKPTIGDVIVVDNLGNQLVDACEHALILKKWTICVLQDFPTQYCKEKVHA